MTQQIGNLGGAKIKFLNTTNLSTYTFIKVVFHLEFFTARTEKSSWIFTARTEKSSWIFTARIFISFSLHLLI